jgi:Zn-dependent protease with chaperone function
MVEYESEAIGLPRTPKLAISDSNVRLHAMGSPGHWYIVISRNIAVRLKADLEDVTRVPQVQAMFVHELYHFKNGDYWQMQYTRELLRTAAFFMLWAVAFLTGFGFFLLIVKPDVLRFDMRTLVGQIEALPPEFREIYLAMLPSKEAWAEMQAKAASIDMNFVLYFIINAISPLVIVGTILWLFYWPKFLRIRELYADAGVLQTQKHTNHLAGASLLNSRGEPNLPSSLMEHGINTVVGQIRASLPKTLTSLFDYHPDWLRRANAWQDPKQVYDHWLVTAISVGGLALILDILLSTPLMLPYQGQWPMHFSVLVISVVVTLNLMTPLVLGEPVMKQMLKLIGVIVALRSVWLALTVGLMLFLLFFAPGFLSDALTSAIVSVARYTRPLSTPVIDDLASFVFEASLLNSLQIPVVLVSLASLVGANMALLRRLYTWYGLPHVSRRLLQIAYCIITVTTVFFGLSVLPIVTTALLRPHDLLDPWMMIGGLCGLLVAVGGLSLFLYANQRYGRRCSQCGADVPGSYSLGKRCKCGELLHPWMIAEYEV